MIARTSIGGRRVRVRLSNAFGAAAVTLGAAHIALRARDSEIVPDTDRVLTFSGRPGATIYAGAVLLSDPVSLDVPPRTDLAVSLFFPGDTGPPTIHTFGLRPTYVSGPGDFTARSAIAEATTTGSYYWLAGIDVLAAASAATLVTFGDSITDGDQSTPDTNGMWPALLAERLQANKMTADIGVVNAGISGNRVLGDGTSGLARLYRDGLNVPGVKWITILEGINDITAGSRPNATGPRITPDDLIAAYRQMIELAHLQGVKVIGCTITPYGGSNVWNEYGESVRDAVNRWIRTSGAFDAVVDFDSATRDPHDPVRFRPEADSPDLLHPANPGYKLMADAFALAMFTARPSAAPGNRK
jgi:lysophospholipase L1-like esterase